MWTGRALALSMILAAVGAAPAAAQATDPAFVAEQNAFWAQQQAAQQQSLELERQSFAAEQRAQTSQALSDLSAARRGQPAPITTYSPPLSATWAARADTIGRLVDEAAVRPTRLTPVRRR